MKFILENIIMKNNNFLFKSLWFMLILFSGSILYAQEECKVLMPEISGTYTGKCKKGLADGEGLAVGTDTYEGRFSKGLPDGTGKYTWADGRVYEGSWSEGKREGKGTMIYPTVREDSIVSGYWKKDEYVGTENIPPYRVSRNQGLVRYSIRKVNEVGSGFSVGLYQGGSFNTNVDNFTMDASSGQEFVSGRMRGIENAIVPYKVSIKYRVYNTMQSQQHDVFFDFEINEPGTFEVTITN
jgi:hypothetical protein